MQTEYIYYCFAFTRGPGDKIELSPRGRVTKCASKQVAALILFRDGVNLFIFVYITVNAIAFRFILNACLLTLRHSWVDTLCLPRPLGEDAIIADKGGEKGEGKGLRSQFHAAAGTSSLSRKERASMGPMEPK